MPGRFKCAVCTNQRAEEKGGKPNFIQAPNDNKICLGCVDTRDHVDMLHHGRISLTLEQNPKTGDWHARNRSGNVRFLLVGADGLSRQELLARGKLLFRDGEGAEWSGRYYPASDTALFQRRNAPAAAGVAAAADGHARRKRPRRRAAAAK